MRLASVVTMLAIGLTLTSTAEAQDASRTRNVLLLHQELVSRPFRARFNVAFVDAIRASGTPSIEVFEEALDTDRFPSEDQAEVAADYFSRKYHEVKIDVAVAVGAKAFAFARDHRSLFGDPAIVATVPPTDLIGHDDRTTGLQGGGWIEGTIDLVRSLRPGTTRIYVVDGIRDNTDDLQRDIERQLYKRGIAVDYLRDLPIDDVVARIERAPHDAAVLYVRQTIRTPEQDLDPFEGLEQVLRASHVPVVSNMDEYVGRGILGGRIWQFDADARRMASMVVSILGGASPRSLPVAQNSYQTVIDWRELQRWGISDERVPRSSTVLFKSRSIYEQHPGYVAGGVAVFAGQLVLIVGLVAQHRRRLRAEREARENETRYRGVVDTQSEMICRLLPDTTITFVNDAYCRFANAAPLALIGRKFVDHIAPPGRELLLKRLAHPSSDHDQLELQVDLRDGTTGWHQWTTRIIRDEKGSPVEFQAVGRDITDRIRAEAALLESELRNTAILRAIPDLMFVMLRDGTYVDFHARDPEMLFCPPSQFIGRRVRDVLPEPQASMLMAGLERAIQTGEIVVIAYELGVDPRREFEARLVRADSDRVLSIVRDVTEMKRAQTLNQHLSGRLIASQEIERQRIARELHDNVSQKIALLNVEIDRIFARMPAGAVQAGLRNASRRASEIATDVHDLSHALHPGKLRTLGLVSALQSLCSDVRQTTSLQVEFTFDSHPPRTINPDVSLCLYRIVQEALNNVARHSRAQAATVRLHCEQDHVCVEVSDSGVGFDGQESDGLGLLSMKERVAWLAGEIVVRSSPGCGTHIRVRIPTAGPALA